MDFTVGFKFLQRTPIADLLLMPSDVLVEILNCLGCARDLK